MHAAPVHSAACLTPSLPNRNDRNIPVTAMTASTVQKPDAAFESAEEKRE